MNRSGIRHSSALAAVVSLAVLTGCGSSDSGDDSSADVSSSSSTSASTAASDAKALTAAELNTASLAKADLTGYEVSTPGKTEVTAAEAVKVNDDKCLPLGRAVAGTAVGEPAATAYRRVTGNADTADPTSEEAALDINTGVITLASYASTEDATAALKSVGDAVTACASGLQWTAGGEEVKASKVTKDTAPEAGEEAVAFTTVTPGDGVDVPWQVVVFRTGATLAHFTVVNAGSMISGKDFTFPAELVTAQEKKLS